MINLPIQLLNSLNHLPQFDKDEFINAHQSENKLTSIRLNPFKNEGLDFELNDKVAWCSNSFYLNNRPYFTHDPLFHAGCYYVQEASSMFIEYLLNKLQLNNKTLNVLDACAAPGGKTTLLNSLISNDSLLVANEFIKSRADLLAYNLSKWGSCNTIVTNNDLEKFSVINNFFDVVLVDAPCSGSGLFRKQPDAINEWSEEAVINCSVRQKEIISKLINTLKNEGYLIYSTCSYSEQENEAVVKWMIHEFDLEEVKLELPAEWGIVTSYNGYRFFPHLVNGEGFYCAVLQKKSHSTHFQKIKTAKQKISKQEIELFKPFIIDDTKEKFKINDFYYFANNRVCNFLETFQKQFYIKKAGTCIGEVKGKDVIPSHELALSNYINNQNFELQLTKEDCIKFLKKEPITNQNFKNGLQLISYKNYGIGWAKILPNRINNYLPNEYRVLK